MKIVGGSYREICRDPVREEFYGSALRAAIAISRPARSLEVVTVAAHEDTAIIDALTKASSFAVSWEHRPSQVQFIYATPMSAPIVIPKSLPSGKLVARDETVLAFGMVDADRSVTGTSVVIDPQGLTSIDSRVEWSAERSVLVANRSEVMAIGNSTGSAPSAAAAILEQYGFDAVVLKRGACGALVVERSGVSEIGVFPVQTVYPIGSGDVFSGVFAYYWREQGLPAAEAARRASLATAVWVSRGPLPVVDSSTNVVNPELLKEKFVSEEPTIYLAGPFFSVAQRWLVDTCREALRDAGADVRSPWHDVGLGPASAVAQADLDHLSSAHGVLALLDGLDPGTLFEVGYAKAMGIPVVGFISNNSSDADLTMVFGTGVPVHRDLSTAVYQSIWLAKGSS